MKKSSCYKIFIVIITTFCFQFSHAQNIDIDLLRKIYQGRNEALDPAMVTISNSVTPISIASPIVVYAVGVINKDIPTKQKGIFIGETLLVSGFFTLAIKNIAQRDRPYETYPDIEKGSVSGSYSFPSGHTSTAFATATSLSMAFPKWYVIVPTFTWASAVGYSRMALGVHYPSDVLAGAIVGSGSAFLTYKLNKWINKKRTPKPKILWE